MPAYEFVQLPEEALAALTSDKIAHVLVINEIEKILVPTHLGYVDRVVKAILPNLPTRRLDEVEVYWQTRCDDPDLAWQKLEARGFADKKQYQIAQLLIDAGYGGTCICIVVRKNLPKREVSRW